MSSQRSRLQLRKDTIIHQHDLLMQSIPQQRISLRDKNNLLNRLDEISNVIAANRNLIEDDLHEWETQLAAIQDDLQNALGKLRHI